MWLGRMDRRTEGYLEGELGRAARGDGTERAPEVDGGGEGAWGQQHWSLRRQRDTQLRLAATHQLLTAWK